MLSLHDALPIFSSTCRIAETPASISGASLPRTTRAVCSSENRSIGGLDIITQVSAVACALNRVYRAKHDTGIRSEERRVGKELVSACRSRWSPYHYKKNQNTQIQHTETKKYNQ